PAQEPLPPRAAGADDSGRVTQEPQGEFSCGCGGSAHGDASGEGGERAEGTSSTIRVPRPGWLWMRICPPQDSTSCLTTGRPRPVPAPVAFVVKKGSKMRA